MLKQKEGEPCEIVNSMQGETVVDLNWRRLRGQGDEAHNEQLHISGSAKRGSTAYLRSWWHSAGSPWPALLKPWGFTTGSGSNADKQGNPIV